MRSRVGGVAAAVVGLLGLWAMVQAVDPHDPVAKWLTWRLLVVLALTVAWGCSCLSLGLWLVTKLRWRAPLRERLLIGFAMGVLSFGLATFCVGLGGGLGPVSWLLLPLTFFAVGARGLLRTLARARRLFRRLPARRRPPLAQGLATSVGVVVCAALYLTILHPRNLIFDAQWYHQTLAEAFAGTGRITAMPGGWFGGITPHLASFLFSWSYCAPVGQWFDHLEQAVHLEFLLLLVSFAAIGVLVNAVVPRPRIGAAWVGRFLFPGLMLYDSAPGGGADHVLAFFAIPIALTFRRLWRTPSPSTAVAFGLMASGALLTKYQAISLLLGPALALAVRLVIHLLRRRGDLARALLLSATTVVLATTPHWLANTIWYGNPVYPYLLNVIGGHPTFEGMKGQIADPNWQPKGTTGERLLETAKETARFGFKAHDWWQFHGERPTFGSLLLIALALAPFAPRRRWALSMGLLAWAGVPVWYWTHHQDRYLQALAPWMAAVVVALFVLVWRARPLARPVLVALGAFQVLHTGDLYFLPTHLMTGGNSAAAAISFLGGSEPPETLVASSVLFLKVRPYVPREGVLLIHEDRVHLGLGRRIVNDDRLLQGSIDLAQLETPSRLRAHLAAMGVTHVWWRPAPMGLLPLGDDVAFYRFAHTSLGPATSVDGTLVAPLLEATTVTQTLLVRVVGCTDLLLRPVELTAQWPALSGARCGPREVDLDALGRDVDVVVVDRQVSSANPPGFDLIFTRDRFAMFSRPRR